jgi:hypothetical protein
MFAYPTVVISNLTYSFLQYWWLLSILTMMPAAYANYSLPVQGAFYTGLILGTVLGELLLSGRQSDWLLVKLAQRKGREKTPEMRLWFGYPGAVLTSVGLIIWGLSIDRSWHWVTGQVAFFICKISFLIPHSSLILLTRKPVAAGIQIGNTAVSTYNVDSYYEHSMDVITFYAVILNVGLVPNSSSRNQTNASFSSLPSPNPFSSTRG